MNALPAEYDLSAPLLDAQTCAVGVHGDPLLTDVSFALQPGACIVIAGPSGCGKTTLLRGLAGLDDLHAGEVLFRGVPRDAHGWPDYRSRAVYVQQRPVMLDLTVEANLHTPCAFSHVQRTFDQERAVTLMEGMALPRTHLTQRAQTLSVGQQQRIGVIRALLIEPDVLLLDEPSSALDASARDRLIETLKREHLDRGGGIIACAHDRELIDALGGDVIDLEAHAVNGGRIHAA